MARDPKGNDRDRLKQLPGQGDLAIGSSNGILLSSEKESEVLAGKSISVFFSKSSGDRGTHVNFWIYLKNALIENAIKLLNI